MALLAEERQQVVRGASPEPLAGREGQLERGRPQVRQQDVEVLRVEARLLRRCLEEVLGVRGHVLVDGTGAGHQDGHADVLAAPGAAHLLPGAGDGARVAGQHGHVQPADVDAELQGVGADDAEDLAGAQAGLDGAPLRRQVAAAIAAHALQRPAPVAQRLPQAGQQQLHGDARPPEDDGLAAGAQERERRLLGETQRARPDAHAEVGGPRVEHHDVLLAARRAVAVDHADRRAPGERLRELAAGCRWSPSSRRSAGSVP